MQQFFTECAVRLGKTQIEFENGYYVMDVFDVLDAQRKVEADHWLKHISVQSVPYLKEEDGQKLIHDLRKQAGYERQRPAKFDEMAFTELQLHLQG